jgi:putative chitinase
MAVTQALLIQLCPSTKQSVLQSYVDPLNTVGEHFGLYENTKRMAAFLAQVIHESAGLSVIKENLNYSAQGLTKTFSKYFPTLDAAQPYAKNPEKIANKVYADRMGNGPESSGDGYKFCGRGLIQLTGKNNYTRFATSINMKLDDVIAYMETTQGATASAGWFWDVNKLNVYADSGDFKNLTIRINGGTNGLDDRTRLYQLALQALS